MRASCGESALSSGSSFGRVRNALHDPGHRPRVHQRRSTRHLLHIFNKVPSLDLLEHVARSPGHDAGVEGLVVGEAGQHQAGQPWHVRTNIAADLNAAAFLEPDVEYGHIGLGQRDAGTGLPLPWPPHPRPQCRRRFRAGYGRLHGPTRDRRGGRRGWSWHPIVPVSEPRGSPRSSDGHTNEMPPRYDLTHAVSQRQRSGQAPATRGGRPDDGGGCRASHLAPPPGRRGVFPGRAPATAH